MYIGICTYMYALGHNGKFCLSGSCDQKQWKNTAVSHRAEFFPGWILQKKPFPTLHPLLSTMVCKSQTLEEDAHGLDYSGAEEVHLGHSWGACQGLGYLAHELLKSGSLRRPACGGEATAQRWHCWNPAGRDGSSGIPNPAGEQNCHLVNHKTIFVLARRALSIWKIQTVFNT